MVKLPMLIQINPECLSVIRQSDIRLSEGSCGQETKENLCCERMKKADYLVLPSIGIAHINLNFCPCCGRRLIRREK